MLIIIGIVVVLILILSLVNKPNKVKVKNITSERPNIEPAPQSEPEEVKEIVEETINVNKKSYNFKFW
jgi:predicted Holliday junction resolvase-like endonuclease